jgi:hypothetical protein
VPRFGGGQVVRGKTALSEGRNGTLENNLGIAPQRASGGVVDQDRLAERGNLLIIREYFNREQCC